MKLLFFLFSIICFVTSSSTAQVNEAIPTPNDLVLQGAEILSKKTLPDGTVEIRYKAQNGNTYRRTISPAKKGEVQIIREWTEGLKGQNDIDPSKMFANAKGTGNTTGHIANILVTNNNDFPVDILPQNVFIPSDGKYQSYVGRIPDGITVPPGQTNPIPVTGYCTDIHTPPVPPGTDMPPFENWIPVHDPNDIIDGDDFPVVTTKPVASFVPGAIPDIVESPGYTASPPSPDADIIITWPGTDIPVGGTLDPKSNPEVYAPVIVKVLDEVEQAYDVILQTGEYKTPFSGSPSKEEPAVIQQIFWIYTSGLSEEKYEKENFADKVIDQYEDNSGTAVSSLPSEQKEKLEEGIDDFWNVFTAVGVEAKVIAVKSPAVGKAGSKDAGNPPASTTGDKKKGECSCESITFAVNTDFGGLPQKVKDVTITKLGAGGSESIVIERSEKDFPNEVKITVTSIRIICNPCGDIPCEPYARKKDGDTDKMEPDRKNKVKISKPTTTSGKQIGEEKIGDNSIEITTKPNAPKQSSYYITFRIDATCMAADCTKDWCYRDVSIEIRKLTDAEKAKREKEAEAERIKAEKKAEAERKKAEKAAKKVKKG